MSFQPLTRLTIDSVEFLIGKLFNIRDVLFSKWKRLIKNKRAYLFTILGKS